MHRDAAPTRAGLGSSRPQVHCAGEGVKRHPELPPLRHRELPPFGFTVEG